MSTWLPKGAEAPKSSGNYLKLIEGSIKFRTVSEPIFGWEYWTENNKPVRLHEDPKTKPSDVRLEKDGSYTVKHFWAFKVIDREDGMVKIFEITQNSIKGDITKLLENADWGDPQAYDITIIGTGKGLERRYTVQPSPHKPLTAEEKSLVARTEIDLNALFKAEDPFIAKVEDEVKLEDVPF
jgi:hypothetical protein